MKRRVLLVDDEVAVLLTLKAVLEINGFEVETAASAKEGRLKLRSHEYDMVISDLRMESDQAGSEVIAAARKAANRPAIALLTAFPLAEEDWQEMGADHMLVKPTHTRRLLEQIDHLFETHTRKLATEGKQAQDGPTNGEIKSKSPAKKKTTKTPANTARKTPAKTATRKSEPARARA
ncbi:response regulator [Edaphobacter flagellatus]|uniref:response regulator n=1 Tax=Edaphobacter flagellatus TaxID=1933044 RepID=UPI0021B41311|nr:response regulator [Edaphobacter flagellatus]